MRQSDFSLVDFNLQTDLKRGPSLAEQAYKRLKMQFLLGEMKPGQRFTFREIAKILGISVTPAREAIFKLVAERIFEPGPTGTIVVPPLQANTCRELWQIRILLEAPCAEIAAKNIDDRTIEALEESHRLMMDAKHKRKLRAALKHNFTFHFTLYQKANSPILLSLIQDIWARSTSYVEFFHSNHVERRTEMSAPGPHMHTTIINALKNGDAKKVRVGLERDLIEIRDGILRQLTSEQLAKSINPTKSVLPLASAVQRSAKG